MDRDTIVHKWERRNSREVGPRQRGIERVAEVPEYLVSGGRAPSVGAVLYVKEAEDDVSVMVVGGRQVVRVAGTFGVRGSDGA